MKNAAAATLAKLRWAHTTPQERSAAARHAARARWKDKPAAKPRRTRRKKSSDSA